MPTLPWLEGGHLVIRIGHAGEGVLVVVVTTSSTSSLVIDLRDGVRHAGNRLTLNVAATLDGAHGDDILGRTRRGDRPGLALSPLSVPAPELPAGNT